MSSLKLPMFSKTPIAKVIEVICIILSIGHLGCVVPMVKSVSWLDGILSLQLADLGSTEKML